MNTIPIRCQIPDCGYEPRANILKNLLNDPLISGRNLWEKYIQTQLKVALAKSNRNSQEVPVTCAFCGKYAEFYVKASPDYWQKTEKCRFQAQIAKEQALFEATKKLKEEMDQLQLKPLLEEIREKNSLMRKRKKWLIELPQKSSTKWWQICIKSQVTPHNSSCAAVCSVRELIV
jgi:hypothetical protein